jgi:hypothetical protein
MTVALGEAMIVAFVAVVKVKVRLRVENVNDGTAS